MKRKELFLTGLLLSCLSVNASAEIIKYEDDYLSFEYDDQKEQSIRLDGSKNSWNYNLYSGDTDGNFTGGCRICFISKEYQEDYQLYFDTSGLNTYEVLSEDPIELTCVSESENGSYTLYRKLLEDNDSFFIYAQCSYPMEIPGEYLLSVYDSIELKDNVKDFVFDDNYEFIDIYNNVTLSEQNKNYARKAVEISEQYLSLDIDPDEALSEIEDIYDRCDEYCDNSDYYFDFLCSSAIYSLKLDIEYKHDHDLIDDIADIKNLCRIE